jgi:DNA-binding MarR family transcriptional regulator
MRVAAARDVRLGHVAVLAALRDFGPASQRELCERLSQDPSDMVALLDDLESAGQVRRAPDPGDRRRKLVTLTARGGKALDRLLVELRAAEDELLAPLSERERAQLHRLARKVLAG